MTNSLRQNDLAKIHMAKTDLGLDDDTYRDMLFTVARVRSAADLDFSGRRRVLDHLKSRGWRPGRGKKPRKHADPLGAKILALWLELRDRGLISDASEAALGGWLKRQTGVQAIRWLDNRQAHLVIEALKRWIERNEATTDGT